VSVDFIVGSTGMGKFLWPGNFIYSAERLSIACLARSFLSQHFKKVPLPLNWNCTKKTVPKIQTNDKPVGN
jgi:hypothetical protein